jgi:hypothetical protein
MQTQINDYAKSSGIMFRVPAGVKQIRLKLSPYSPKTLAVSQVLDKIVTDGDAQYSFIVPKEKHVAKSHAKELWETGTISNKTIEGAFSLFKRGVVGAYHHLSEDHLNSYLGEFCWRYNRRKMQPWMFQTLLRELVTNKPLTYKTLTRETF